MTKMDLKLKGFPTYQDFKTLNIGQIEENFGMDRLHKSNPSFMIAKEPSFLYMPLGNNSMCLENWGFTPLRLIKMSKLVKGIRKGPPIHAIKKLSKPKNIFKKEELKWFNEENDVFPIELIDLSPTLVVDAYAQGIGGIL